MQIFLMHIMPVKSALTEITKRHQGMQNKTPFLPKAETAFAGGIYI